MQLEIIQNGRTLRRYNHDGRVFVEAPPTGDYQIRLTNNKRRGSVFEAKTGRQLAVVSVDGLNIVTGEKAGFDGPGYVIEAGQTITIPGWRRSDSEVAAFEFKPQDEAYSAQMGHGTSNTGIIGVAVFDEKDRVPAVQISSTTLGNRSGMSFNPESSQLYGCSLEREGSTTSTYCSTEVPTQDSASVNMIHEGGVAACAAAAPSEEPTKTSGGLDLDLARRSILRSKAPELGTGYGSRRTMYTLETTFDRATEKPGQLLTIQYAVRAKLREWGIPVPEDIPTPAAFPASPAPSTHVQAPPGWRG